MQIPKLQCETIGWDEANHREKRCERDARYLNSAGQFLCSLCDMRWINHTSIRIGDVPLLLTLLAGIDQEQWPTMWAPKIKELIWRKK